MADELNTTAPQVDQEAYKGRRKMVGCFVVVGAVIMGLLIAGLWLLAATQLVRVPVLSAMYKQPPQPTRVVDPSEQSAAQYIAKGVAEATFARITGRGGDVTIVLPETVLTRALQKSQDRLPGDLPVDTTRGQVAVFDGYAEVYLPTQKRQSAITVILEPSVDGDRLEAGVSRVRVGHVWLPRFLMKGLVSRLVSVDTAGFLGDVVDVRQIELRDGEIDVTGLFNPSSL